MPYTREAVHEALETRLNTMSVFETTSRIKEGIGMTPAKTKQPALYIVCKSEPITQEKGSPAIQDVDFELWVYCSRSGFKGEGQTAPATPLNTLLDAIDVVLAPDPVSGYQTLGGIVAHCWKSGSIRRYENHLDTQVLAIYPVNVRLNQDNDGTPGQFVFDAGYLYAIPNDLPDGSSTNRTPVRIGNLKNITVTDVAIINAASTQLEYPVVPTIAGRQITCVAQLGSLNGWILNQVIYGRNLVAGMTKVDRDREYTIPVTPFQITVTPPSSGTFSMDLGVVDRTAGTVMKLVTGTPTTGQYSIASNVYTFAAANAGATINISYTYTVATGNTMTISNEFKGRAPSFMVVLNGIHKNREMTMILNELVTERFALPTVLENFMVMDLEFTGFANTASGEIGTISLEV